jgi:heme A synthase
VIQSRTPGDKIHMTFRILAVASLVAAFTQVTLGGIVRVTGSGLGCPDWPLCHGQLVPPFEFATLVEYTHRLSAATLGILVLATAVVAWLYYRNNRWVLFPSVIGLVLVFIAAVLGGATVLTELKWWIRLFHLGIAEGVVACMVIAVVAGWRLEQQQSGTESSTQEAGRFNRMVIAALVGVFLIILSGSYMVGYGAGSSCGTWPLCRGSLFPEGAAYAVHMGHRYLAALVGLHVLATAFAGWRRRGHLNSLGWAAVAVATAFVAQVMAGAAMVWAGFAPDAKALHLSLATLVWIALVWMAALAYVPLRFEVAVRAAKRRQVSKLEGLTS